MTKLGHSLTVWANTRLAMSNCSLRQYSSAALYSTRPLVLQLLPAVRVANVCWAGTALFNPLLPPLGQLLPVPALFKPLLPPLGQLLPGRLAAAALAAILLAAAPLLRRRAGAAVRLQSMMRAAAAERGAGSGMAKGLVGGTRQTRGSKVRARGLDGSAAEGQRDTTNGLGYCSTDSP